MRHHLLDLINDIPIHRPQTKSTGGVQAEYNDCINLGVLWSQNMGTAPYRFPRTFEYRYRWVQSLFCFSREHFRLPPEPCISRISQISLLRRRTSSSLVVSDITRIKKFAAGHHHPPQRGVSDNAPRASNGRGRKQSVTEYQIITQP